MNAHGKTVDRTYLSVDQAEDRGFIHRDYIAHCLRWTHVCKRLMERSLYKNAAILDVGCGRELPLAKLLYSSKMIPLDYYGVDAGPVNDEDLFTVSHTNKFPVKVYENTDFCTIKSDDFSNVPNVVTCFEMLEHVEPFHCLQILNRMKKLTSEDAVFFISTPCWNVTDCAGNHVNEIRYEVLGAVFERCGFVVQEVYGTFASIRDYVSHLNHPIYGNLNLVFEALREYYDSNFLSCVFAPLFPQQSRNCLWVLRKASPDVPAQERKYPLLEECPKPWSSSTLWEDFAKTAPE